MKRSSSLNCKQGKHPLKVQFIQEEQMTEQPINPDITSDDKLWALLSWLIWPVALAMLLLEDKKSRPFTKYNAVLGLVFAFLLYVLGTITAGTLFVIGGIYALVMAIKAYQGEWVQVPLLTDFVKKQGWV
jgi:uncharacterized membrane protein